MSERMSVGICGATGMVGQQLLLLLENHPWFLPEELVASERRAGLPYGETTEWLLETPMPAIYQRMTLKSPSSRLRSPLIFSCLNSEHARKIEPFLVERGHLVVSNASAFRMNPDIPLIIPEVNPATLALLARQRSRGNTGAIVTNPNCVVAGLALALAPLHRLFTIRSVVVVTLQAVSGAGVPGPPSISMHDNLIPWIDGEEIKIADETAAILDAPISISVAVHRVSVVHGHTMSVFVETEQPCSGSDAIAAWSDFQPPQHVAHLPSAPESPIRYLHEQSRPQPRLDRMAGGGMTVTVGRARICPNLGLAFEVCVHNLIRGAAGAALLNAELCVEQGWLA